MPRRCPEHPKLVEMRPSNPKACAPCINLIIVQNLLDALVYFLFCLDSPCSLPRPQVVHQSGDEIDHARPAIRGSDQYPIYTVDDSDSESESDIRVLAAIMGSVTLTAPES